MTVWGRLYETSNIVELYYWKNISSFCLSVDPHDMEVGMEYGSIGDEPTTDPISPPLNTESWHYGCIPVPNGPACGIQLVFGYYLGAQLAIAGDISVGTYLAYVGMVIYIIFPMRNLGRVVVQMSTGLVSYKRVADILRVKREPLDEGDHTPPAGVERPHYF